MEIDELIEELPISWGCAPPGLRIGGDRFVDIVMTVHAAAVWGEFSSGAPPGPGFGNVNGLRNASLRFSTPTYASVMPLSLLKGEGRQWMLPELSWKDRVHVAFRISLHPELPLGDDRVVHLVRVRLTADSVSEDGANTSTVVCSQVLGLPLLREDEWHEITGDPQAGFLIERLRGRTALVLAAGSDDEAATWPAGLAS